KCLSLDGCAIREAGIAYTLHESGGEAEGFEAGGGGLCVSHQIVLYREGVRWLALAKGPGKRYKALKTADLPANPGGSEPASQIRFPESLSFVLTSRVSVTV